MHGPSGRAPTTTLFAALDVATGEVVHECLPRVEGGDTRNSRPWHQEFLRFLRKIERSVASELDIHVILDNYATHKHPAVRAWLDKHPRVHFQESASWTHSHFILLAQSRRALLQRTQSTRRLKRLAVTSVEPTNRGRSSVDLAVVMGHGYSRPFLRGRPGWVEGLDLALLSKAKTIRGIDVETHHVAQLFNEVRSQPLHRSQKR